MADSCGPSVPLPAPGASTNTSGRKVMCVKFQKELPGLDSIPWPGDLGQRIYDNVSKDAWKLWEERMKMILNEYRLMPWQKEAQDLVAKHMEDFFFGESAALPPGYVPQQAK
jgi:Fe-S cluster biosynthesis and repair protein YggX